MALYKVNNGSATQVGVDKNDLLDFVYPIGSIYMSANNVSPSTFLGGGWEQIKDKFLLSAGDNYAAGTTGGEASHTLTGAESGQKNLGAITSSQDGGNHTHGIAGGSVWAGVMNQNASHSHKVKYDSGYGLAWDLHGGSSTMDKLGTSRTTYSGNPDITFRATSVNIDHQHLVPDHSHTCGTTINHTHTVTISASNASQAHNNMPPYLTVYCWKRVS